MDRWSSGYSVINTDTPKLKSPYAEIGSLQIPHWSGSFSTIGKTEPVKKEIKKRGKKKKKISKVKERKISKAKKKNSGETFKKQEDKKRFVLSKSSKPPGIKRFDSL
jgi:hypothetical protein